MNHNIGAADRKFRIIVGTTVIISGLYFQSWWGAIGLIPLITVLVNWCPAYLPFGISTCKVNTTDTDKENNGEVK